MKNYHANNSASQFLGGQLGASSGSFSGNFARGKRQKHRLIAQVLLAMVIGTCVATAIFALGNTKPQEKVVEKVIVERTVAPKPVLKKVLVPIRTIERGKLLKPDMFKTVERPVTAVAQDTATEFQLIAGKFAVNSIPANRPFPTSWTSDKNPSNIIASTIPKGFRAVAINTNATSSVEGWARAGAHVDLHWITQMGGELSAKLLVENVKILSAERQVDPNSDPAAPIPTTVTLMATGADAQKISLAANSGQIVMHLRGFEDETTSGAPLGVLTRKNLSGENNYDNRTVIEGTVIVTGRHGEKIEMALINGKLQRKDRFVEINKK